MDKRTLRSGTTMMFGIPATPMPEAISHAIGQAVSQVPGIREAYLPQCFIEGDSEVRQILVLGVDRQEAIPSIMNTLMEKLQLAIPGDMFIDILPYQSSAVPREARVAECKIFGSDNARPWWKFW